MSQYAFYPSSSAGNPSVGTNGATAPTSSTEVGGIDNLGNLHPLQTNAAGELLVSIGSEPGAPFHVIVDSSALPTGAATAANQATEIASLASIDAKLTSPISVTGPLTDAQLRATPVPVSGTVTVIQPTGSNLHVDVDSSALPTGAATAANQATEIASLASIDSKLTSPITVTGPLTDTQLRASPVPVSAASLPLPSGAATSALQTTGNTSLASIDGKTPSLGQALAAASVPVVLTAAQLTTLTPLTSVTVTQATGTNLHAVIDSGTVAATQSGTWTVQPGNTANTTAWLVNSQQKTPAAGTVTSAAITVGTSAVRLTVSGSAPSANRSVLMVTPDSTSTATFYIGPSGVTNSGATRGVQIVGGQPFTASNDAGDYYIISSTAGQTVYVTEQA